MNKVKVNSDLFVCFYPWQTTNQHIRSYFNTKIFILEWFIDTCQVYTRLDQPLTAIEVYNEGLTKFPSDTSLLTGIARIHEVVNLTFVALIFNLFFYFFLIFHPSYYISRPKVRTGLNNFPFVLDPFGT